MVGHSTRTVGVGVVLLGVVLSALLFAAPIVGASGATPLAEAGLDQQVLRGETVRLDATGSYDPDGSVVAYEWHVRTPTGRTLSPVDSRAARTTFRATAVGRYEVNLTVTDDDGNVETDTMYVVVGAGAEGSTTTDAGSSASSSSSDTDPSASRTSAGGSTGPTATHRGCPAGDSGGGDSAASGCRSSDRFLTQPWAGIEGPWVVQAERSYTYTAVAGGLADDRSYDWDGGDSGRTHTLQFRSGGTYTVRVVVEDGLGRSATSELEIVVEPVTNEFPEVDIADPGSISAGQRVTLSVEASDPDGRVRSTEWSPGRQVSVPDDGSVRTVRVTVTDDDGASATDSITVSGSAWNRTEVGVDTTDVTCYFTDERQRDGRNPFSDRCIWENANTVSLTTGPSRIESFRQNEKIDLHWRRISRGKLQELEANDTGTNYGAPAASPLDEADQYGYSDDPVRTWTASRWASVDNDEAFTLNGETVDDDLDGDGEVNAADWDLRHRTSSDTADVDPHVDASAAFKRSIRDGVSRERLDGFRSARRATARTIEGTFAGTSIDAEIRRDRIAEFSRRTSGGGDSGDGSASDDGNERSDGTTTDEVTDVDNKDDTDDADRTDGTEREDTDSGTEGRSRHSPHGGRIVTHP